MPLRVHCPSGHVLMVPDGRAGKAVKCPRCKQVFVAPATAARFDVDLAGDKNQSGDRDRVETTGKDVAPPPPKVTPPPVKEIIEFNEPKSFVPPPSSMPVPPPVKDKKESSPPKKDHPSQKHKPRFKEEEPSLAVKSLEKKVEDKPKPTAKGEVAKPEAKKPADARLEVTPVLPSVPPKAKTGPEPAKVAPPAVKPPQVAPEKKTPAAAESVRRQVLDANPAAAAMTAPLSPASPLPPPPIKAEPPAARAEIEFLEPPAPPSPSVTQPPMALPPPMPVAPTAIVELPSLPPASVSPPVAVSAPAINEPPPPPLATLPPVAPAAPAVEIVPPAAQVAGAYQLAAILIAVACFSMGPACWETFDYLNDPDLPLDTWALVVFALGLVQIAYAVYIVQIPDWTSAWVVSLLSLALAAGYGCLLGIAVMSAQESSLIRLLQLDHEMSGQKVLLWAVAMICTTSLLAWYAGHCSSVWHRKETVLRQAGLAIE